MATITQQSMPAVRGGQLAAYVAAVVVAAVAALAFRTGGGMVVLGAGSALLAGSLVLRRPVVGICIYVVTLLFTYPNFLSAGGNITINNVLGLVFMGMLAIGIIRERPGWLLGEPVMVALAIAALIFIVSAFAYMPPTEGSAGVVVEKALRVRAADYSVLIDMRDPRMKLLTRYLFLVFLFFFVRSPREITAVMATVVACLVMTYFSISAEAGPFGWGTGRVRVLGDIGTALYTGRNPNKLAYFALFCLALTWYYRSEVKHWFGRGLWLVAVSIPIIIIPLTASRSGVLNLLLFLAIVSMEGRFGFRRVVAMTVASLALLLQFGFQVNLVGVVLPEGVASRLTQFRANPEALAEGQIARGSFEKRGQNLISTLAMIPRHPVFGVGLGNFSTERAAVDQYGETAPPHNSYLWATVEGGLVVLILYLYVFASLFKRLRVLRREYAEGAYAPVGMKWAVDAMHTSLIGFVVFCLFADMWVNIVFYIIVGLCLSLIRLHEYYRETGTVPGGRPTVALAA